MDGTEQLAWRPINYLRMQKEDCLEVVVVVPIMLERLRGWGGGEKADGSCSANCTQNPLDPEGKERKPKAEELMHKGF